MAKKIAKKVEKHKKASPKAAKKPVKAAAHKKPAPKAAKAKPAKKPAPAAKKPAKAVAPAKAILKKAAPKGPAAAPKKAAPAPKPQAQKSVPKPVPEKVAKKPPETKAPEEELVEEIPAEEEEESDEVVLTDAEGRRYCRVKDCDQVATVDGYCRYHYLLFWKKIQVRKKILTEGKLERYIDELTARYPDKFLDMLRKDLRSDKEFLTAIAELEIDESANESEFEDEAQNYIEEVRGMGEPASREDEDF